jgi:hypothetical protein
MMLDSWIIYKYTAEPLVPEPSIIQVEIVLWKLKSYKFPGTEQILAEMIKAGGENFSFCGKQTYLLYKE